MSRHSKIGKRIARVEGLESRKLMAADFGLEINVDPVDATNNDTPVLVGENLGFGVEREMKESGEKGGTEDINIGVGELQEVTVDQSMDSASALLAQIAINDNSNGTAEIDFVEIAGGGDTADPVCYLKYKLDRAFIKSWSISGDADDRPTEEVTLNFTEIEHTYKPPAENVDAVMADGTATITFTGLE